MAGLSNEARLNMVLAAEDQAGAIVADLAEAFDGLREQMAALSDLNPFAGAEDGGTAFLGVLERINAEVQALREQLATAGSQGGQQLADGIVKGAQEATDSVAGITKAGEDAAATLQQQMAEAGQGIQQAADEAAAQVTDSLQGAAKDAASAFQQISADATTSFGDVQTQAQEAADAVASDFERAAEQAAAAMRSIPTSPNAPMNPFQQAYAQGISPEDVLGAGIPAYMGGFTPLTDAQMAEPIVGPLQEAGLAGAYTDTLGTGFTAENIAMGLAQPNVGAAEAAGAAGGGLSLGSLMMGGGALFMGAMGLGMAGSSASQMTALQSVMQATNMTPQQAEQLMAELSVGGISGSAAPAFLSGLSSNLSSLFTITGSSGYSKNALLLQSLGINADIRSETSGQQLQTIMQDYQSLMQQHRGSDASQMLGLLGLSQLQPLAANWSQVQQQTSGFNLGMSGSQVQQSSSNAMQLNTAMAEMSMYLGQLAAAFAPVLSGVVQLLGPLTQLAEELLGPLLAALQPLFPAFEKILVALEPLFGPLGKLAADIAGPLVTAIADWITVLTPLMDLAAQVAGAILNLIDQALKPFDAMVEQLMNAVSGLVTGALTAFDNFASKGIADFNSLADSAGNAISDLVTGTEGAFSEMASAVAASVGNLVKDVENFFANLWSSIENALPGWVRGILGIGAGSGGSATAGGATSTTSVTTSTGMQSLAATLTQALGLTGEPSSWLSPLMWIAQQESGGNPSDVNQQAVNYKTGQVVPVGTPGSYQAEGLMQMMLPTFQEYMLPGMNNIMNGLDNAVAAIRYIASRYPGGPTGIPGFGTANYTGYASGGVLTEPVAGMGLDTGTPYMFGEAGPEMFMPVGAGGGFGGGTTININVQGATPQDRAFANQIADAVMSRVVGSLKRRVGFDMSPG